MSASLLLDIRNLSVKLPAGAERAHAVEEVSFSLQNNEILCVVGESGSGKSITCLLYTSPSPRDLSTSRMPSSA